MPVIESPAFDLDETLSNKPLMLAPMDGYSDSPTRRLTRELGSAISYTEFISCSDVENKAPHLPLRCSFCEEERPIFFQLYDEDPDRMVNSAIQLYEKYHPDGFDINMGCSVNKISSRGAGAGLLLHPDKIEVICANMVKNLSVPVTIKIRKGWDYKTNNYLTIGKIAQDNGISAITLHGRTREQHFHGKADLSAIRELKQSLSIPVIGNGDIKSSSDIERMLKETGCDGVMIGRAAVYNPWIFSGYDSGSDVPKQLFFYTIRKFFSMMTDFYGPSRGCLIFRKYAKRYLSELGIDKDEITSLVTTDDPQRFIEFFTGLMDSAESSFRDE